MMNFGRKYEVKQSCPNRFSVNSQNKIEHKIGTWDNMYANRAFAPVVLPLSGFPGQKQ